MSDSAAQHSPEIAVLREKVEGYERVSRRLDLPLRDTAPICLSYGVARALLDTLMAEQTREEWRSVVQSSDGVSHHHHESQAAAEHFRDWRTAAGRGERNDGMVWSPVEITIHRRLVTDWEPVEQRTSPAKEVDRG